MSSSIRGFLLKNTYVTGTVAYGMKNCKDEDRFCTFKVHDELKQLLLDNQVEIEKEGSFKRGSLRFSLDPQSLPFDVFPVPDEEIETLQAITSIMREAAQSLPLSMSRKAYRVHLFETLRAMFKLCGS